MNRRNISIILGVVSGAVIFALLWMFVLREPVTRYVEDFKQTPQKPSNEKKEDVLIQNPITGELVKESDAVWKDMRPLGVMVNNYIDARMQSGLDKADIVYEVVAEGGITRFLPFFLSETPEKIGPVRSTREYYLVITKEMGDAMLMHEGYSPQAKEAIDVWPVRSLFRGGASGEANWRDDSRDVAFEHTLYTNGKTLREVGDRLGWQGKMEDLRSWLFKDDAEKYASFSTASEIDIDFWYPGDYSGRFEYSPVTNSYLRFTGGEPHIDFESKKQLEFKNVIVQFAYESSILGDDKNRLDYELVGSGDAFVFLDGKVIPATWTKEGRDGRTIFYDKEGNELMFNRGKIWLSIVPDRNMEQVVFN